MLPEDFITEIARVLLNDGDKPTFTKLRIALSKNYKSLAALLDPIVI